MSLADIGREKDERAAGGETVKALTLADAEARLMAIEAHDTREEEALVALVDCMRRYDALLRSALAWVEEVETATRPFGAILRAEGRTAQHGWLNDA